jgi:hypothetical protein
MSEAMVRRGVLGALLVLAACGGPAPGPRNDALPPPGLQPGAAAAPSGPVSGPVAAPVAPPPAVTAPAPPRAPAGSPAAEAISRSERDRAARSGNVAPSFDPGPRIGTDLMPPPMPTERLRGN